MTSINELNNLRANIYKASVERGLIIFDGEPNLEKIPFVVWHGDWLPFLDLAQKVHADLLYICEEKYDPDTVIVEETGDEDIILEGNENEIESSAANLKNNEKQWLLARIRERIVPWDARRGEVTSVSCVWMKNHVAHNWRCYADWIFDCREAIDAVLEDMEEVEKENRVLRTKDNAKILHECATQMAHHPRFPEATNQEKREFMASQLFSDLINKELFRHGGAKSISQRASLIYWWDVEPLEKVTKIQRVQALRAQGESLSNIAVLLKMSEAKVRAAINTTL